MIWTPSSWQASIIKHMPLYKKDAILETTNTLKKLPKLVTVKDINNLKRNLKLLEKK